LAQPDPVGGNGADRRRTPQLRTKIINEYMGDNASTARAEAAPMSHPRRVLPGMTVMVTRRTLRRTHLLRPDPRLNNLFLYCLAVLTRRYGIALHVVVVM
jgi:hypothetical protein